MYIKEMLLVYKSGDAPDDRVSVAFRHPRILPGSIVDMTGKMREQCSVAWL